MAIQLTDDQLVHCPDVLKRFVIAHGRSYAQAAKVLGIAKDTLGAYGRGRYNIPDDVARKITGLMQKKSGSDASQATHDAKRLLADLKTKYPKSPLALLKLASFCGGLNRTTTIMRMHAPEIYKTAKGARQLSEGNKKSIEEALAKFEGGATAKDFGFLPGTGRAMFSADDYPSPVSDLLRKYNGNISAAARAVGYSTGSIFASVRHGVRAVDDDLRRRIEGALADQPVEAVHSTRQRRSGKAEADTCELGLAIVLVATTSTEIVNDAAEAMDGKWVLRQHMGEQWLMIARFDNREKMLPFARIARHVAAKVALP